MKYSDPLDQATANEEAFTQASIEAARKGKSKRLAFIGRCHNCDDPVDDPHRFCPGGECLEDWEKRQAARKRNGQ